MTEAKPTLHSLARKLTRRFRRDDDGVVAIEFALIVPILIVMYLGLVQVSLVIMQDRRVSHAASVMADLATRVTDVDEAEAANILQAGIAVMQVNNGTMLTTGNVQLELLSYEMDGSGTINEIGRAGTSGWSGNPYDPSSIDPRLLSSASGAVVARVRYRYTFQSQKGSTKNNFASGLFGADGATLEETFVLKPRLSTTLPFVPADGSADDTFDCSLGTSGKALCDGIGTSYGNSQQALG